MSNNNPFKQAAAVKKHLKVMVFGQAGSGKTTFALTAPNAAVIDTERGTDMYAGRDGIAPFGVLRANTIAAIKDAIKFLKTGKHDYQTVILDSITPAYDVLVSAVEASAGKMTYREWGVVKRRMNELYNMLLDLPMHVIVTARESTEYETVNGEMKKVGTKHDGDKSLPYAFDFILQMNRDKSGTVIKSRGRDIAKEGGNIKRVTWDIFAPVLDYATTGESVHLQTMDEAIEREDVTDRPAQTAQTACIEPAPAADLERREVHVYAAVRVVSNQGQWGLFAYDSDGAEYKIYGLKSRKELGATWADSAAGWDTTPKARTNLDGFVIPIIAEYDATSKSWWFAEVRS